MSVASNSPVTSSNVNTAFMSRTAATTSTIAVTTFSDTTQSTDKDTGAVIVQGGVGVEKNVNVGGNLGVIGDTTITGNLIVNGATTTVSTTNLEIEDALININDGGSDATSEGAGLQIERTTTNAQILFENALASKFKIGLVGALYEVLVSGVAQTISGIKTFADGIATDTIAEETAAAGVTIDGVLIKDGLVDGVDVSGIKDVSGYETTAGNKTLIVSSPYQQFITGASDYTVALPVTTTLSVGWAVLVVNKSTAIVTVDTSGGSNVCTLQPESSARLTCTTASGTAASSWSFIYDEPLSNYTSTATAAGTTTLTFESKKLQFFTGTTTQTVVLPATTSTFYNRNYIGDYFDIVNNSTGTVTLNASDASLVQTILAGENYRVIIKATGGATNADWEVLNFNNTGLTNPMTTGGDIIYGGASGVPTRLANGTAGQVLQSSGTTLAPTWSTVNTSWVSYTPILTGFGTPSAVSFYSRRIGDTLQIRGKFTSGTSTAVEARASLGFDGVEGSVTSSASMASIEYGGPAASSATTAGAFNVLIEPSVGYVTFGLSNATNAGLSKKIANTLLSSGDVISFTANIPINGW